MPQRFVSSCAVRFVLPSCKCRPIHSCSMKPFPVSRSIRNVGRNRRLSTVSTLPSIARCRREVFVNKCTGKCGCDSELVESRRGQYAHRRQCQRQSQNSPTKYYSTLVHPNRTTAHSGKKWRVNPLQQILLPD